RFALAERQFGDPEGAEQMLHVVIRDSFHIAGVPRVNDRGAVCLRRQTGAGRIVLRQRRQVDRLRERVIEIELKPGGESLAQSPLHGMVAAAAAGTQRGELAVLTAENRVRTEDAAAETAAIGVEIEEGGRVVAALRFVQVIDRL